MDPSPKHQSLRTGGVGAGTVSSPQLKPNTSPSPPSASAPPNPVGATTTTEASQPLPLPLSPQHHHHHHYQQDDDNNSSSSSVKSPLSSSSVVVVNIPLQQNQNDEEVTTKGESNNNNNTSENKQSTSSGVSGATTAAGTSTNNTSSDRKKNNTTDPSPSSSSSSKSMKAKMDNVKSAAIGKVAPFIQLATQTMLRLGATSRNIRRLSPVWSLIGSCLLGYFFPIIPHASDTMIHTLVAVLFFLVGLSVPFKEWISSSLFQSPLRISHCAVIFAEQFLSAPIVTVAVLNAFSTFVFAHNGSAGALARTMACGAAACLPPSPSFSAALTAVAGGSENLAFLISTLVNTIGIVLVPFLAQLTVTASAFEESQSPGRVLGVSLREATQLVSMLVLTTLIPLFAGGVLQTAIWHFFPSSSSSSSSGATAAPENNNINGTSETSPMISKKKMMMMMPSGALVNGSNNSSSSSMDQVADYEQQQQQQQQQQQRQQDDAQRGGGSPTKGIPVVVTSSSPSSTAQQEQQQQQQQDTSVVSVVTPSAALALISPCCGSRGGHQQQQQQQQNVQHNNNNDNQTHHHHRHFINNEAIDNESVELFSAASINFAITFSRGRVRRVIGFVSFFLRYCCFVLMFQTPLGMQSVSERETLLSWGQLLKTFLMGTMIAGINSGIAWLGSRAAVVLFSPPPPPSATISSATISSSSSSSSPSSAAALLSHYVEDRIAIFFSSIQKADLLIAPIFSQLFVSRIEGRVVVLMSHAFAFCFAHVLVTALLALGPLQEWKRRQLCRPGAHFLPSKFSRVLPAHHAALAPASSGSIHFGFSPPALVKSAAAALRTKSEHNNV